MPTDAQRVQDVFLAASELRDPAERATFLDGACAGDAALRSRVEALLRAHDHPDSLLDHPAVAPHEPDAADTRTVGHEGCGGDDELSLAFLAPATRPESLGRIGHYEVLQVLGRGAFGIVFRAFDEMLHRVVAVKVLSPQLAATSPARKRFLREARSSAQVRHVNVVQVYEVGEHPLPYIAMEFIPGETLQQRLDRTGPLDAADVLRIGRQIAEGLAAAHATDLIHRDIKPGNVLLEGGHLGVKLTDFGLARAADDASLSQSGVIAGTPMYMAPEQAKGETLDQRADLFSLGSVLYQMAAGHPPFRASGTLAVLKRVAEDTPRPIREVIPETPQWLCDFISRLHAKDPADRFQSAREVADLLGRCLAETQRPGGVPDLPDPRPAAAAPTELAAPATPAAPPAARRPRVSTRRWLAAAAVLLAILGGLGATEAADVTNVRGTVIRLFSPEGTLVVEVDDPEVSVQIDGSDVVITGAGAKEIRMKPGRYAVEARKDGKVVSRELITVTKNGRVVVRVSQEPGQTTPVLPEETADAKAARLMKAADEEAARVARAAAEVAARVRAQQEAAAKQLGVQVETTNAIGMELRLIPAGTFTMGSTRFLAGGYVAEAPKHDVEITRPFYIGATEVTVGQYRQFVKETNYTGGDNQWKQPKGREQTDNHPVVAVFWEDAVAFCKWLSEKEGTHYRLPTEAEWEYACRAGTGTDYSFGDDPKEFWKHGWFGGNSKGTVQPVKGRVPNAWGLYDMHGNASEFCHDFYDANYYKTSPRRDPRGPADGDGRVKRGGEAHGMAELCRSAFRGHGGQSGFTGFRVVQTIAPPGGVKP